MRVLFLFTNNKLILLCIFFLIFLQTSFVTDSSREFSSNFTPYLFAKDALTDPVEYNENLQTLINAYLQYSSDPITSLYNERLTQNIVKEFFIKKTASTEITNLILFYTEKEDLPISIVFSLVMVESNFRSNAINVNNNASKDMGLFQLNTKTFHYMQEQDFFHLETNVKAGIGYLKYAFKLDPDPKIALAIYNAGPSRPLQGIIPASTQKYIARILAYSQKLTIEFKHYVAQHFKEELQSHQSNS